ncbi:MAG: hypothetical protein JNM90_15955 [Burkholderiales bacterium]|nr:hypothetical protein [Burkholderiales bacterium]
MKKLALAAVVLVLAVAGGVFWLNQNLDGLVKGAIEKYGSAMTGAKVSVESVRIAPADGRGVIRGLVVGNPPGFRTAHLAQVGEIEIAIDLASLTGAAITVRKIGVRAAHLIYEKGDAMTNVDAVQKNIADYLGPSKPGARDGEGRKLIVEELAITGTRAEASAAFMDGKTVGVKLPDLVLRNIGKAKGGVTPGELGQEIVGALKARLAAAVSFDALMKSVGGALEKAGGAVRGLFR